MVIIIQGVTGAGKSALAYDMARALHAEIISADSRQIYRYADIGTNKEQFPDIQTHLIDIRDPNEIYSAHAFKEDALGIIHQLEKSGKHCIITGGTPFYIDVLTGRRSIEMLDDEYKKHEEKTVRTYTDKSLYQIHTVLEKLSTKEYASLNQSEKGNKQRLIKKIARSTYPKVFERDTRILSEYAKIGISIEQEVLKRSIPTRTSEMISRGLYDEVQYIFDTFGEESIVLNTIGYVEWLPYLTGGKLKSDEIERVQHAITQNTLQYAKRQMTWLKKDTEIFWYHKRNDLSNKVISEVIKKVNR